MKFLVLMTDTIRECIAKKIVLIVFILSTFAMVSLVFILNVDIKGNYAAISAFFGQAEGMVSLTKLREIIIDLESAFAVALYTGGTYLTLFAIGDIIPTMMTKGRLELYLARPISRSSLLLSKYAGASLVIILNIIYAFAGIWFVLGIKTGIWNVKFFYALAAIVFMFSVFYSFMILISILSRNTAVTIIIMYFMMTLTPLLANREALKFLGDSMFMYVLDILYWIIPKYAEVAIIAKDLVRGTPVASWTPVASSLFAALIVMNLSVYIFSKKDL